MYPLYRDIRERLGPPVWIDKHGVPRYSDFSPQEASEIYCDWVALMTVKCQSCGKTFQCANSASYVNLFIERRYGRFPSENTAKEMVPCIAGWGDAPWHDQYGDECGFESQCAGTTMTTDFENLRVWFRDRDGKNNEFEVWAEISEPENFLLLEPAE